MDEETLAWDVVAPVAVEAKLLPLETVVGYMVEFPFPLAPLARVLLTELEPAATATELLLLMLEESEVEAELFAAGGALAADEIGRAHV